MTKRIIVMPHDAAWSREFEKIRAELADALGALALAIEHVGSTSVAGLSAKPIIDIDVVIEDYNTFEAVKTALAAIGYEHNGDQGIKDRQAFNYEGKAHLMRHHLYVCPSYSAELRRHLALRDYLRTHEKERDWYGEVKTLAAQTYPEDIESYLTAKGPCIAELLRRCMGDAAAP